MNREPHFGKFALTTLLPFAERFPIQYLLGKKNCRIAYRFFEHQQTSQRQLLILVNGRASNLLKWTEVAYDFYQRGFDVLAFDHRGQGYSQRLLPDTYKGHIDHFEYYLDDLDAVIHQVCLKYRYQQQIMLAHSFGGLISSHYLAKYPHAINKLILTAPLFSLKLRYPILSALAVHLMVLLGQGSRMIKQSKNNDELTPLFDDSLNSCKSRLLWISRIHRRYPELGLGNPTFQWLHQCLNQVLKLPQALQKINIPVLILQAEQEKLICNQCTQNISQQYLSQVQLKTIVNAKHELLFERDQIRNTSFEYICQFIDQ